jgi:hypothetical protein
MDSQAPFCVRAFRSCFSGNGCGTRRRRRAPTRVHTSRSINSRFTYTFRGHDGWPHRAPAISRSAFPQSSRRCFEDLATTRDCGGHRTGRSVGIARSVDRSRRPGRSPAGSRNPERISMRQRRTQPAIAVALIETISCTRIGIRCIQSRHPQLRSEALLRLRSRRSQMRRALPPVSTTRARSLRAASGTRVRWDGSG